MKSLSKLTDGLKQSEIRSVTAMVNEVGGVNLGQGICDLPTPDPIKEGAKQAIDDNKSIYSPLTGINPLREKVVTKLRDFNKIQVNGVENVLISSGSTGCFLTAMFALLEPGDEVISFEPFYGYHRNILNMRDINQKYIRLRSPDWEIPFDEIEQAITPKTKAVLITTPANPFGKVWTKDELETLLKILKKHDLYAITDEVYEYMTYEDRTHTSLASLDGALERTITLSSFSKTYNMTGWRLGFACGPAHIIEKMGLINDLIYICAPTPLQHGLDAGFNLGESYFSDMLADFTIKRKMMCDTLEKIGFEVPWPEGAYYVLASFKGLRNKPGFANAKEACQTLIEKAGVGSVPGYSFYVNPEDGKYELRFCFAKKMADLERACEGLLSMDI